MHDSSILWLQKRLPVIERIWRRVEPDFYGASHIIAQLTQRKKPPISFATWRHGWIYFDNLCHPKLLTNGSPPMMNLVANDTHVSVLRNFGYTKLAAVGLPYLYANIFNFSRISNSLIVMPGHTLEYTDHTWNRQAYVNEISALKPYFDPIVACVHSSCVAKGYWVDEFQKAGIAWITGADVNDKNALLRIQCIFKSFEYMTTNTIGSHLAYAAYSGCKPSIYGDYVSHSSGDFKHDPFYLDHPELVEYVVSNSAEEKIRTQYPHLFKHPTDARECNEWGAEMVGEKNKKTPEEISKLLGWNINRQISGYVSEGLRLLRNPQKLKQLLNRRKLA
jgi:hypothetical protein